MAQLATAFRSCCIPSDSNDVKYPKNHAKSKDEGYERKSDSTLFSNDSGVVDNIPAYLNKDSGVVDNIPAYQPSPQDKPDTTSIGTQTEFKQNNVVVDNIAKQGNSAPLANASDSTSTLDNKANRNLYSSNGSDTPGKTRSISAVSMASELSDRDSGIGSAGSSRRGTMIPEIKVLDMLEEKEDEDNDDNKPTKTNSVNFVVGNSMVSKSNQEQLFALSLADGFAGDYDSNELTTILTKLKELSNSVSNTELKQKRISLKNFAAAFLTGERGGLITIPVDQSREARPISISIPPGALPTSDKPQLVYIYISHQSMVPRNDGKSDEAWITPNVRCGPAGLKFLKPVFLTIPYKSHIDSTSMEIVSYQKKASEGNKWKHMKEGVDTVTIAHQDEITLLLNHFCEHGCTAVSKWLNAIVLVEREETDTCHVLVHLYDINTEFKVDDSCDSQAIEINDDGQSIQVNINEVHKSWTIPSKPSQEVEFSNTWFDHSNASVLVTPKPDVKFTAKLKRNEGSADSSSNFSANVDIYQHNNHRPSVSLKAVDKNSDRRTLCLEILEVKRSMDDQFLQDFFDDSKYFVQQSRYTGICTVLDTATEPQGCWKKFGDAIGISEVKTLLWIDDLTKRRATQPSPAATLLDFYLKDARSETDILHKLRCLSNIFLQINNHSAKNWVDEEIADHKRVPQRDTAHSVAMTAQAKTNIGYYFEQMLDKACQVVLDDFPADVHLKKKKTFRQKTKKRVSKMFGIKASSAPPTNSNEESASGMSNEAYSEDQSTVASYPIVKDEDEARNTLMVPLANGSRKASELSEMSKDSGFESRPQSLAQSETSTIRPLSAMSTTSTIRPNSAISMDSTTRYSSIVLNSIDESVEERDEDQTASV